MTECSVPDGQTLVGLPARPLSADELVSAGLSKAVADLLVRSESDSSRWCFVQEFAPQVATSDSTQLPIADSQCGKTELEIPRIVHTLRPRVRISIARSPTGGAALEVFEPV